ncbi:ASCC2 protein, partial [Amia calva]|nr:ASCC2 protein [Amia calva]
QGSVSCVELQHPKRMEQRGFVLYRPLPLHGSPAEVEEFVELSQFIVEDLDWLLALPHDKYWCQVVFDESLQKCLDSYLCMAPRGLDSALYTSPAVADMQKRLHRNIFMTFLRMATHKESKENFITPAVFGEILYNNFLFDIPKILDLCVLFGKGNQQLLHKMIKNIFNQQPAYYSDLEETVPTVLQVLDTILQRCGLQAEGASASQPMKLGDQGPANAMDMKQQDLVDLVLYLCDTCTTLYSFLDIFPTACRTFQIHGFLSRLASFYELAIPDIERAVRKRNFDDKSMQEDLWRRVSHSRRKMVEIAHLLIQHTCLQPILENSSENIQMFVEDFLQTFTSLLPEKRFLADYDEQFSVADDISLLQQASPLLDETRTSYLLQGIESAWEILGRKKHRLPPSRPAQTDAHEGGASWESGGACAERGQADGFGGGAEAQPDYHQEVGVLQGAACMVSSGELESLLSHVKELFPDLGEGFILACLQEYGYSSEIVINNILEDNLMPSLAQLDRNLPRPVKEEKPAVLSTRSNVFDDDEFDVFSRDQVDTSRIWKGRRQGESARELLNDKQHIEEQRARYQAYQTVVDEVLVGKGEPGSDIYGYDYDDEYDDTYDDNQVGANDLDEDSELLSRRPFITPLVLRMGKQEDGKEEEDDGDEEEEEKVGLKSWILHGEGGGTGLAESHMGVWLGRSQGSSVPIFLCFPRFRPEGSSNVAGGPRGQGQSKETVQDRRKKEANKSGRANHNRRAMADRKRNKGMIPS